ncbi:hypothetical protein BCR32DRAFT_293740 [Anaeromyces robustus]|uniref:CCDC43 PWI-like domain-containing protein n=1 Tax=Anaeromyces robustus TaxID=1754192 RepID=A0A1Y1X4P8_9FUNG|nr:hypothetical protein BCR32DRAFT_293740 [Anaeromyces robustus]|eukprot:ORX80618.1 hypothetical protein BCR32DRAFT_293740 [Anaeromyces robustus]
MEDNNLIEWVNENLKKLDIEDETVSEYITGMVEEIEDEEECREAVGEYLTEATEKPIEDFMNELFEYSSKIKQIELQKQEEEKIKRQNEAKQKEMEILNVTSKKETKIQLTDKEREKREKFLEKYSYNLDRITQGADGEEEIEYVDHSANDNVDDFIPKNTNADIVKEKERKQRMEAKKKHLQKVERDKKLLEKQRLDKEKEKRRTQKREKRRM